MRIKLRVLDNYKIFKAPFLLSKHNCTFNLGWNKYIDVKSVITEFYNKQQLLELKQYMQMY